MAALADIKSPVWSLSKNGGGAIVQGLSAIRQCLDIIFRTTKGSDPLRPDFGSDIYKFQDYPVSVAIPNTKKALLEAVKSWEPRVSITSIAHKLGEDSNVGQVYYNLFYRLADGTLTDSILLTVSSGGIETDVATTQLILQGLFPPNPNYYQYLVDLMLNGEEVLPAAPPYGFNTVIELFDWVQANWSGYGRWYLNADSIVGYMNGDFATGSISISLSQQMRFEGGIPPLPIDSLYDVEISVDDVIYSSGDTQLYNSSDILSYVQSDSFLGPLGEWQVITSPDSFNDDFNDDFSVYTQFLQVYTNATNNVIITITTVSQ